MNKTIPANAYLTAFMGKWLGVAQRTAWKMGHAVRQLMGPSPDGVGP